MHRIAHFTSVHQRKDVRIFLKECSALAACGYTVTLYVADGQGLERCAAVRIKDIGIRESSRCARIVFTSIRFLHTLIRTSYDVYHFHDPELLFVGFLLKCFGRKVVYDAHEDVPRQILSKPYIPSFLRKFVAWVCQSVENAICSKLNRVVCATPSISQRFSVAGIASENINNYPFLGEFAFTQKQSSRLRQVCYVGGITAIRGAFQMVSAMRYSECKLVLAGEFEDQNLVQCLASDPGWKRVSAIGFADRSVVRNLLAESAAGLVLFLPEPNHVSAQPNKLFEYMSAGLPVIASNFPLWREIVEGNDCGICVDPTDPEKIANAINEMIAKPERAIQMGNNGRKAIEKSYNWDSEKSKLLKLYSNLLKDLREHSSY